MYRCMVLVKQVPDTHHISGDVMTPEGTMNRSALPAIFNPEDLHALEMALQVKQQYGAEVTVLSMGPLQATAVLRDALFRGADRVILVSDRKFAGADTQATSYTLAAAIKKAARDLSRGTRDCFPSLRSGQAAPLAMTDNESSFDLIFCGRQAIDGDTAQVGPQVAEKLGLPQITYAESIVDLTGSEIVVQRAFEQGTELVKCQLPALLTVVASANQPRPASARKRIEYKLAAAPNEYAAILQKYPDFVDAASLEAYLTARNLKIPVWSAADLGVDETQIGLAGSPTQVHKINFVVLEATESKEIPATYAGVQALIHELIQEYIIG
jgi:electron transfer flavoprotein beta subunit